MGIEIVKESRLLGTLVMREVDFAIAKEMIIKNHYSKKWNTSFGKINIGVFKDDVLLGVAVFGNLMNPNSYTNVSDLGKDSVIELNRLWISDELGHNAETILISSSFKIIKEEHPEIHFVQSFADGRLGVGTIYKASNFKYFGYTESLFYEDVDTGEVYHKVPLENTKRPLGFLGKNVRFLAGKLKPFKVKTYRYIYPLYRRDRNKIKLEEKSYPVYDKGTMESDYKHPNVLVSRLKIMYNMINEKELAGMCEAYMENNGLNQTEISELDRKNSENKSVIWFADEYLPNNRDKIVAEIKNMKEVK